MTDVIPFNSNRTITPEPGLLLEGVQPTREEEHKSGRVFIYRHEMIPNSKGIIYPGSEILSLNEEYNVLIDNVTSKEHTRQTDFGTITSQGYLLHSHVFHDFQKGDELNIQVKGYSRKGDPMIKIPQGLGFIKDSKDIKPGDKLRVRIHKIVPSKRSDQHTFILSALERL